MKFEDLKVGSTYELAGSVPHKVMFLGAYYAVVESEGYPYPTTFTRDDRYGKNPFKKWVLVKPKLYKFVFLDSTGFLFKCDTLLHGQDVRKQRQNLGYSCGEIVCVQCNAQ